MLFHIITHFIFSQIRKLHFYSCWCFDMFYYHNFGIHQNVRMNLTDMWVQFKLKHLVFMVRKCMEGRMGFSHIFWLNWNFYLQVQSLPKNKLWICCLKKGRTHLVISCPKKAKSLKENFLLIFQSLGSKQSQIKKRLFKDKQFCGSLPPNKCVFVFADS